MAKKFKSLYLWIKHEDLYQDSVYVYQDSVCIKFESEEGRGGCCLLWAIRRLVPCELGKSLNLENGVIAAISISLIISS